MTGRMGCSAIRPSMKRFFFVDSDGDGRCKHAFNIDGQIPPYLLDSITFFFQTGLQALHFAAKRNNIELADELIKRGAKVNCATLVSNALFIHNVSVGVNVININIVLMMMQMRRTGLNSFQDIQFNTVLTPFDSKTLHSVQILLSEDP